MDFTATLLDWYAREGRDLPWRRSRSSYAVWLCEIIMQQTRIAQGTAYWERFMATFPSVEALAAASEDEVLRLWEGLGYYSRARNLHEAARQIVARGAFPDTFAEIRTLKGVGDYTAAAIASIAFGRPEPVVDGNVYRVLSRFYGLDTPVGTTAARRQFTELARTLLPAERPGDFNEALMDFGALCCTPRSPRCGDCPLKGACVALREGRVENLPVKTSPAAVQERFLTYIYIRCAGYTAWRRRGPGDIWQGLWEPFLATGLPAWTAQGRLRRLESDVRHQLTHRLLHADFYLFESDVRPDLPSEYVWMEEEHLERLGKSRLVEMLLEKLP